MLGIMAPRLVFLLLAVTAVAQPVPSLDQAIERATGSGAVDCGTFSTVHNGVAMPPRASSKAKTKVESMHESLSCAEEAIKKHRGFKIVQVARGFEGQELASGVLGNVEGVTVWFWSDSEPCGGPGCLRSFQTKPCALADVDISETPEGKHLFRCGK
jgi:hypothetical protein